LLNSLPAPAYDEDKPIVSTQDSPQTSSTGLFIPYTLNKKKQQQQQKKTTTVAPLVSNETVNSDDDDDDDDQTDFLGLTKSNQVEISNNDVESVLRETFPKPRPVAVERPQIIETPVDQFVDLDEPASSHAEDDDEVTKSHRKKSLISLCFCFSFFVIYRKANVTRKLKLYISIQCLAIKRRFNYLRMPLRNARR